MIISIDDIEYPFCKVIDLDTNEKLFVQVANDETGEYEEYVKDSEGRYVVSESGTGIKTAHKKGNIKIVRNGI